MKNTKNKIIALILVLILIFINVPVQCFAAGGYNKYNTEYRYVVADTSLVEWYQNTNYANYSTQQATGLSDEQYKEMLLEEQQWLKNMCNDIANGTTQVYSTTDFINKKAEKSEFVDTSNLIMQSRITKMINNCKSLSYNTKVVQDPRRDENFFVSANGFRCKNEDFNEQVIKFSNVGIPWSNYIDNFTLVGTFLGDYKDYNNSLHFYGEWNITENGVGTEIKIDANKLKNNQFNEDGDLIAYVVLVPRVYWNSVRGVRIVDANGKKIKHSPLVDKYFFPNSLQGTSGADGSIDTIYLYEKSGIRNKTEAEQKEFLYNFLKEAGKNDKTYSKYSVVKGDTISANDNLYITDIRQYQSHFDDLYFPLENIEGYTSQGFKIKGNNGFEETSSKYWKIENGVLKAVPLAFARTGIGNNLYSVYKNTYTHKINFVDTEGNPLDVDFKDYQYKNKFGENNDKNVFYVDINENDTSSPDEFQISSIVWNNESNSFYSSNGELLKQDFENVPTNPDFNMFDNSFDVSIPKSLCADFGEYTFEEIQLNGEKIDVEEVTDNDKEYYRFNTDITKGVTTTSIVFKKKEKPPVINDAVVNVKYINENGVSISDDITIYGKVNDTYETKPKEIFGYELVEQPTNATGFMTFEPITVNYVYRLKDARVIVHYLDNEGNEIADTETITGKVFDKYTTEEKDIDGYILSVIPTNATGTMTEVETVVTYVYEKQPEIVIETPVEMGDEVPVSLFIALATLPVLCIIFIIVNKKRRKNI